MAVDTGEFMIAGAQMDWPIGVGAGPTNHPDIEVVARRVDQFSSIGVSALTAGTWKLGDASGGNAHLFLPDGTWMHQGGDEYVDLVARAGHNSKGLPGPGVDGGLSRLGDLLEITESRKVRLGLSLSPHSGEPLAEFPELLAAAKKALKIGVYWVELNLSCPNIPDRPAFYKDLESVMRLMHMISNLKGGALVNRLGERALFPKFGPMDASVDDDSLRQGVIYYRNWLGGVVTSNTIGNQEPKLPNGEPAILVNKGRAGMSGPACAEEGSRQLLLWNNARRGRDFSLISVLGVAAGDEVYQRLKNGADAVQAVSAFYWPELVDQESAAAVADMLKEQFVDSVQSSS
jgi:dihydroorotate dehydrogenase